MKRLIDAGILSERRVGRSRLISANRASPLTAPLREILLVATGPAVLVERLLETKSLDPVSQLIGLLGMPGIGDAAWRRLEKRGSGPAEEVRKVLVKHGRTER